MSNNNRNDDQDEIMDNSFSFFAEELIKSIFDYQLGRIFNNKKELVSIPPKGHECTVSDNYLGKEVIKILQAEIPIKETGILIISFETRTQIKILVELEGEGKPYNLDGEQKVDVGILFEYKSINKESQKIMIPFEVKTGESGLHKKAIKVMLCTPDINIKKEDTIKGNMLGILSRTPINLKTTHLITDEHIPLTKTFGLIIRNKIYDHLKDGKIGGKALLEGGIGGVDKNTDYNPFRTNHTFFGLENIFKNFADEYFSNEYPEAVLYHTLEHLLESDQKNENKDIDIIKIVESKTRKTKEAFNKFVHQFLNTMEKDFYKVWIGTE